MRINLMLPSAAEIVKELGIDKNGAVQRWHTQNVLRRMVKYMPMQTGMFATKQTIASSASTITTTAPQAYYLYYGKRMVNADTGKGPAYIKGVGYRFPRGSQLKATNQPLNYTTTFNPKAGPYWDRRLVAAEGDVLARELQRYLKSRR